MECHAGDEKKYGEKIVKGSDSESKPLVGRRGLVEASLQTAVAGDNLHLKLSWPKTTQAINWPTYQDLEGVKDDNFDTKLTVMFDNGSIEEFTNGGCWAVCHADEKQMAMGGDKEKYLAESRSKMHRKRGGQDNILSDAEIQALIDRGVFVEYWQASLNPGAAAEVKDGTILKERTDHETSLVTAVVNEQENLWEVEFVRPLQGGAGWKALEPGNTYTIAFALHDQSTAGRYHLTSFEFKLVIEAGSAQVLQPEKNRKK